MLRKMDWKKLVEYEFYLYILILNEIWVEWVDGMSGPITIYDKSEPRLLFMNKRNSKLSFRNIEIIFYQTISNNIPC